MPEIHFFFLMQEDLSGQNQSRRKLRSSCCWRKSPPPRLTSIPLLGQQLYSSSCRNEFRRQLLLHFQHSDTRLHITILKSISCFSFVWAQYPLNVNKLTGWFKRSTGEQPLVSAFNASRNEKNGRKSTPSLSVPPALDFVVSVSVSTILFVLNCSNCCLLFTLSFLEFQICKLHSSPAVMYHSEKTHTVRLRLVRFAER